MNDKHLLWWVFKAIEACRADGVRPDTLLSETLWANLAAPAWVLPAMREARDRFENDLCRTTEPVLSHLPK